MSADAFRRALEDGDVAALRSAWSSLFPGLPQPRSDAQAEIVMHRARTEAGSVSLKARAWSHRWLVDHDLPSGLPDELRPRAERIYPRIAAGVGIVVKATAEHHKPAALYIRKAMEGAVLEAEADGRLTDTPFVRARMADARRRAVAEIYG